MKILNIINNLQRFNIQLQYEEDQLKLKIPIGKAVPYKLINDVQDRKQEIIDYLKINDIKNDYFLIDSGKI